jgi:alkylated DNA repair dioxygenase AlkB
MFGVVVGVSLASACRFRFQRGRGAERLTAHALLEPRSAYALDGQARWQWKHSIPPAKTERYSVTYRTLRRSPRQGS